MSMLAPSDSPPLISLFSPFWLLNLTINADPGNTELLSGGLHLLDASGKCSVLLTWIP